MIKKYIPENMILDCISLADKNSLVDILYWIYEEVEGGGVVVLVTMFEKEPPVFLRAIRNKKEFVEWGRRFLVYLN